MKSLSCPDYCGFCFPKQRILHSFRCIEKPSSSLMTVIFYVSVSNRRKEMCGKAVKIVVTEWQEAIL